MCLAGGGLAWTGERAISWMPTSICTPRCRPISCQSIRVSHRSERDAREPDPLDFCAAGAQSELAMRRPCRLRPTTTTAEGAVFTMEEAAAS